MILDYDTQYKNSEKQLKKRYEQMKTLTMLKDHIKACPDFKTLKEHPISILYKLEPLRENLSGYYSFNVNKNGGTIRLIFSVDEANNIAKLSEVNVKHYNKH